jgi:hypothetical protein
MSSQALRLAQLLTSSTESAPSQDGPASICSGGALACACLPCLCFLLKFVSDPLIGVLTSLLGEPYATILWFSAACLCCCISIW